MTNKDNKRKVQPRVPKIYHTSAATVDRDQAEALKAAKRIFGNTGPKPLPSPIKKPHKKRK